MGHKVPPFAQRIGITHTWRTRWFVDKGYATLLHKDLAIRNFLQKAMKKAGVADIIIERTADSVIATVHVAKPGVVIGKGGKNVDEMKKEVEKIAGTKVQLNIQEVDSVYKHAALIAQDVASSIERRISYRRSMKQVMKKAMEENGIYGIKIKCSGRLNGVEIARRESMKDGAIPLHTLRADIDYGFTTAETTYGTIGVKVWLYKGEVL